MEAEAGAPARVSDSEAAEPAVQVLALVAGLVVRVPAGAVRVVAELVARAEAASAEVALVLTRTVCGVLGAVVAEVLASAVALAEAV